VKGAQYLSHRSDLLDEKMIAKIQHLREKAPTHSF
jgi:predicted unusual protein kinase regulating ubiquinone biosynthesis (AarF/ABC1/UbiB family)